MINSKCTVYNRAGLGGGISRPLPVRPAIVSWKYDRKKRRYRNKVDRLFLRLKGLRRTLFRFGKLNEMRIGFDMLSLC